MRRATPGEPPVAHAEEVVCSPVMDHCSPGSAVSLCASPYLGAGHSMLGRSTLVDRTSQIFGIFPDPSSRFAHLVVLDGYVTFVPSTRAHGVRVWARRLVWLVISETFTPRTTRASAISER